MPLFILDDNLSFPPVHMANNEGLLAIGGDLEPDRLIAAYASGIFPWFSDESPILWWSPDPRMVLIPEKFKISKSLRQSIRNKSFEVKFDTNFDQVIRLCAVVARDTQDGTWITQEMIDAYINLHRLGIAHSVETYKDGKLVGGLYGISIGKVFFGESMFHLISDASKVAFAALIRKLQAWDFQLIDAQQKTQHLKSLGAELMKRDKFIEILEKAVTFESHIGSWNNEDEKQQ